MKNIKKILQSLERDYPLIPHTHAGRLFSVVRRMKAEKELEIPIRHRCGVAISVAKKKAANELSEEEWDEFYHSLCDELKRDYSWLYDQLFPKEGKAR